MHTTSKERGRISKLTGALGLIGCWAGVGAIGCAPDSSIAQQEEAVESSKERIVGGQATSAVPAVGALTRFGGTHCTGTLVGPRTVLTAAHCVVGVSASSLRFVIGSRVSQPEHVLSVASVTPHPAYNDFQLTNDIGVVTLAQDAPVAPMGILPSMDASWVGRELIFVGYGFSNGINQTGIGTKRFVQMDIASVSSTTFSYQDQGKNTCNGDSGGPAFAQVGGELLVAGVTSYGDQFCTQFGVDTRVDVYADFLGLNAAPADPCEGETFVGRCDGDSVIWCENETVNEQDCSSQGKTCGFSEQNQYFACVEPEADPCQGETFEGRCDGNTVVWCENDEVKSLDCNQCGFDSSKGFFNCL